MAECRGHAPHAAQWRHYLVSTEPRLAGPVDVPWLKQGVMGSLRGCAASHHTDGGMPSVLELALPEGLCRSCGCASSAPYLIDGRYRAQRSHHQPSASKADALTVELQVCCDWSVRQELHPHLPGYEPDALPVKLQTKIGRIPRCCPGLLLLPRQASAAGSLVSDEKWTCAPGLHWVMRCCRPLARLFALRTRMKWFPQPESHRHRLVHNEEC